MRKLLVLWILGAAAILGNNAPTSSGTSLHEGTFSSRAKLAELQAILDAEGDDDVDDDLMDPDDEGDMQDDQEADGSGQIIRT